MGIFWFHQENFLQVYSALNACVLQTPVSKPWSFQWDLDMGSLGRFRWCHVGEASIMEIMDPLQVTLWSLTSLPPELWEKDVCCLSYPVYSIWLQQPKWVRYVLFLKMYKKKKKVTAIGFISKWHYSSWSMMEMVV